jgi:hypothetical protein
MTAGTRGGKLAWRVRGRRKMKGGPFTVTACRSPTSMTADASPAPLRRMIVAITVSMRHCTFIAETSLRCPVDGV